MDKDERSNYFDLHTTGLGYLNRVHEVTLQEGPSFLAASIAALRGGEDRIRYTYFDVSISGRRAREFVRQLAPAVERGDRVMIRFKLADLYATAFTYSRGPRTGELGTNLKGRLIAVDWAKVNGIPFQVASEDRAA